MPNQICQRCGKKLSKGDGRLRCRGCQPVTGSRCGVYVKPAEEPPPEAVDPPKPIEKQYIKDLPKIPFAVEYPPPPKPAADPTPKPTRPPKQKRFCEDCGAEISPRSRTGLCQRCRAQEPVYLPSQEEIEEACEEIRSEWSAREERLRRAIQPIEGAALKVLHDPRMNQ